LRGCETNGRKKEPCFVTAEKKRCVCARQPQQEGEWDDNETMDL